MKPIWFAIVVMACGGATAPPPAKPIAAAPADASAPATPPPQPFPAECEQYNVAATMLIACPQTPDNIRQSLESGIRLMKEAWNKDGVGPTPEELHDIIEACTSGTRTMNQRAIDDGC